MRMLYAILYEFSIAKKKRKHFCSQTKMDKKRMKTYTAYFSLLVSSLIIVFLCGFHGFTVEVKPVIFVFLPYKLQKTRSSLLMSSW